MVRDLVGGGGGDPGALSLDILLGDRLQDLHSHLNITMEVFLCGYCIRREYILIAIIHMN